MKFKTKNDQIKELSNEQLEFFHELQKLQEKFDIDIFHGLNCRLAFSQHNQTFLEMGYDMLSSIDTQNILDEYYHEEN